MRSCPNFNALSQYTLTLAVLLAHSTSKSASLKVLFLLSISVPTLHFGYWLFEGFKGF